MDKQGEILIYQRADGRAVIDVKLELETIWLNQAQISQLFQVERSVITKHIRNIFKNKELNKDSVCANFAHTASDGKKYKTSFYNLDLILSIGYRTNSKIATGFRIWASDILKEHLIKGYTINEKRLKEQQNQLNELAKAVELVQQQINNDDLKLQEAKGLLNIITNYTRSFILLNQFDTNSLQTDALNNKLTYEISTKEAIEAIKQLKKELILKNEATELFGNQKDKSFDGILGSIVQTFGGEYLYPSIEQQAAHLLYFVIKNHSFTDGNKRIGSFLFVWFLEKNKYLISSKGILKIDENTLVSLALLLAQSLPEQKEIMIKLIINLIKG